MHDVSTDSVLQLLSIMLLHLMIMNLKLTSGPDFGRQCTECVPKNQVSHNE